MTSAFNPFDQAAIQWGAVLGTSLVAAVVDRTGLMRTWPALMLLVAGGLLFNSWLGGVRGPGEAYAVSVVLALGFFCFTQNKRQLEVAQYAIIVAIIVVGTIVTRALVGVQQGAFPS